MKLRKRWISGYEPLPGATQCQLIDVIPTSHYGKPKQLPPNDDDQFLMRLIDEEYSLHPFYGSRRMRQLRLAGMAPAPITSEPHPEHKLYPCLLRGVTVTKPNQVWSTDISYYRLPGGFLYLTAVIGWYSRNALAYRKSSTAIRVRSSPVRRLLERSRSILRFASARTGAAERGRVLDNIFVERLWRSIKHEEFYLKGYGTPVELRHGLAEYFRLYNSELPA